MADTNCRNHFGVTDMSGKGSTRRPMSVPDQTFWDNFDRIFGEGKHEPKQQGDDVAPEQEPVEEVPTKKST